MGEGFPWLALVGLFVACGGFMFGLYWLINRMFGCDPKQMPAEKAPETLVAEVESAVAEVVERSLRENSADWHPMVSRKGAGFSALGNSNLNLAIFTAKGPTGCLIFMGEEDDKVREIELQPVQRARIWQAAKRVLDGHEAAQRIEALTDVVERIGGVK